MNCDQCQAIVQNLLDGGLRHLPEPVQQHVAACPDCAEFLRDLQALQQELARMEQGGLTPAGVDLLADRIRRRISAESDRREFRWLGKRLLSLRPIWWVPAGALAALLLFFLLRGVFSPPPAHLAEGSDLQALIEEHSRLVEPPVLNPAPYDVTFIAMGKE